MSFILNLETSSKNCSVCLSSKGKLIQSFDTEDDGRARGVPEWVAYELRRKPSGIGPGASRPSKWQTDPILHQRQAAPNDATYRGSGYDRGHLCMKSHAWRLGREADRGSHTILNACPQVPSFNRGIWLGLELLTGEWADIYGRVWVVAGPVFYPGKEVKTIGDEGEVPADIPHAFYLIIKIFTELLNLPAKLLNKGHQMEVYLKVIK